MLPQTRYAKSGDVSIAYQVIGEGPIDLVLVPGWVSNIDVFWEEPRLARMLTRLASFSRLILFDKRGTGLSDRVSDMPSLEVRMDDMRAVMDAVGSQRAAAVRLFRRRRDVRPVRRHLPRPGLGAGHGRRVRTAHRGARLSLGPDHGGAVGLRRPDGTRLGRVGRHRGALAQPGRRRALPQLVGALAALERQPGRGGER